MPVKTPVKPSTHKEEMTLPRESPASALIDKIPISLVLTLASPYLAGEHPEDAIKLAHSIYDKEGYTSTLDILGEDMDSDQTCDASVGQYKNLVDEIVKNPLPIEKSNSHGQLTISLKPSMFSTVKRSPDLANRSADRSSRSHRTCARDLRSLGPPGVGISTRGGRGLKSRAASS